MRRVWAAAGVVGLLAVGGCKASTIAGPSDPPTTGGGSSTAAPAAIRAELRGLKVAAEGSMRGYTREKFSIWARESDHCTARQDVLKRDGKKVVEQANGCQPKSGSWYSAYDGKTVTAVAQATIDHVVPLAEAWRSGADHWSPSQRKAFGNDLKDPQLVIASQRSNSSKGDSGPEEWKPADHGDWCTYATDYVEVKHHWKLTTTTAERSALTSMLATCR